MTNAIASVLVLALFGGVFAVSHRRLGARDDDGEDGGLGHERARLRVPPIGPFGGLAVCVRALAEHQTDRLARSA